MQQGMCNCILLKVFLSHFELCYIYNLYYRYPSMLLLVVSMNQIMQVVLSLSMTKIG